jgi:hypothetical protein
LGDDRSIGALEWVSREAAPYIYMRSINARAARHIALPVFPFAKVVAIVPVRAAIIFALGRPKITEVCALLV